MQAWIAPGPSLPSGLLEIATGALLVLVLLLLVLWLRARRARRSQQLVRVDAELDAIDLELALAEQTNRLRIIGELHEVTVRNLSAMASQADGARYAASEDPSAAVRALGAIADVARSALGDVRRVMTLVHEGETEVPVQPGLASVRELFEVMRDAGLVIRFEESGRRFELKSGAELTVFRILQESLTNALKHGGKGTEVLVAFTWTEEGFQLRVDDDGQRVRARRGVEAPERPTVEDDLRALTGVITGPGITAMRERAELFGGVFSASVLPGVGFSVSASFPALKYHNGIHGVNLGA
ncbi:MAG: histidine kinase [Microbacteriaceae bacterium]